MAPGEELEDRVQRWAFRLPRQLPISLALSAGGARNGPSELRSRPFAWIMSAQKSREKSARASALFWRLKISATFLQSQAKWQILQYLA